MQESGKRKVETQLPNLWNPHKIKNNHSRRIDRVKRWQICRPLLFFLMLRVEKPKKMKKHLVTFDSELRRLKSNKKPLLNSSQQFLELHLR